MAMTPQRKENWTWLYRWFVIAAIGFIGRWSYGSYMATANMTIENNKTIKWNTGRIDGLVDYRTKTNINFNQISKYMVKKSGLNAALPYLYPDHE